LKEKKQKNFNLWLAALIKYRPKDQSFLTHFFSKKWGFTQKSPVKPFFFLKSSGRTSELNL